MDDMEYNTGSCGENLNIELESRQNLGFEVGGECGEQYLDSNNDSESDSDSDFVYYPQVVDDVTPKQGQEFQTLDDVNNFYNAYARHAGFSVRKWSEKKGVGSNEIVRKEYVCYKQGKGKRIADVGVKRKWGSIKEGCNARLAVVKSANGTYMVSVIEEGHCHPLATPSKRHLLRSHRKVSSAQKSLTQQLGIVNIPPHQQYNLLGLQAGGFENIGCTQRDLYNYERDRRNEMKGHDGDMLNEYLKLEQGRNPSFTYEIHTDDDKRITRCFWADATSRRAYKFYGDVVIFDTTYNTNRYGLIFAPLMGVNNHGQTTIFACAFLSDETIPSFVWLFNRFLDTMPGDAPKMIITDQDPAMTNAISLTLPNTYHRYCSWHILTKFSEKIDSVKYNAYYTEFSNCIWNSECEEEFDSTWLELVEKSGLNDNKWLQSMYEIRSRWAPAYVNHIFSAGMSSSQRAESAHAFFKRYVSKRNSLLDFMIQFNRGLERQRHEELMEDHKDVTEKPKLKIPHDYLEQMLDIYTHEMFYKFQDEFWESFNFKFELLEEDDNHHMYNIFRRNVVKYKVRQIHYDKDLDYARCTCKKFESWGIPCRHVLAYLNKYRDLDKLPSQYILKRWTKIAKSGGVIDGSGVEIKDDKSYLLMRSQLIKYSLDVIDKALTSEEATKVYTDALSNANEKIDLIVGGGAERTNQMIGGGTSVSKSVNMSYNFEHSYNEPKQVRAKGCGKRLKGGKEKALVRGKNHKARKCHGCGKVGVTHDKRNCPMLTNRITPPNEDATLVASLDNDSDSSTGWST